MCPGCNVFLFSNFLSSTFFSLQSWQLQQIWWMSQFCWIWSPISEEQYMHMGVSDSATTVTNFIGATSGFSLIGAFLSDSYISRSKTMLLFGPLEFLVIFLLVFSTSYSLQRYFAFSVTLLNVTKIFCIFCCFTKCKPINSREHSDSFN